MSLPRRCIHGRTERQVCAKCNTVTTYPRPLSAEEAIWCDVCGRNDDAPHTPIDHPWLLKGHRLIPKPKVDEMIEAAVNAERTRHAALLAAASAIALAYHDLAISGDMYDGPDETLHPAVTWARCNAPKCVALRAALDGDPK